MMDFLTRESVSTIMIIVSAILILNGGAIVVLGSADKEKFGRYVKLATLVGGLVDSAIALLIIIISITLR